MYEDIDFNIHYGNIKIFDVADGPGVRVSLYVSGCSHGCEGCHNKEAWDYNFGKKFTYYELQTIITQMKLEFVTGFSILGGEPLDPKNRDDIFTIIEIIKSEVPDKSIWLWTGYTWEEIIEKNIIDPVIYDKIDVIVDGKFDLTKRDISLKYRGSPNQRVIDVKKSFKSNSIIYYQID